MCFSFFVYIFCPNGERRGYIYFCTMSEMKIIIRTAETKDSVRLASLSAQLGYPVDSKKMDGRLEKILKHPDNIVLVACEADCCVGWIQLSFNLRVESEPFAEITGLVVDEGMRSRGVGKLLVEEAERRTKEKGISKIRVRSNVIRNEAHRFYLNLGYTVEKEQKVFGKTFL